MKKRGRPRKAEGSVGAPYKNISLPITDATVEFFTLCKQINQNPSLITSRLIERYLREQQPLKDMIEKAAAI